MLLAGLLPIFLAFFGMVAAMPSATNAERLQRGLPLKPPGTRVRRQGPSPSQGNNPGVDGVFQIERRGAAARRDLEARAAPAKGFMSLSGDTLTWTYDISNAVTLNFPTDAGTQQPLRVHTNSGLQYISLVLIETGTYELRTTPVFDGLSRFTWTSVTRQGSGSNVVGYVNTKAVYFRLDGDNNKLIGSRTFAATPAQNPIWIFVSPPLTDVADAEGLSAEAQKMVRATNDFRAQYGADAVTYNSTLASFAQSVADSCVYEHSGGDGKYGENLAYGPYYHDSIGAVKTWGPNEAPKYNYSNPVFGGGSGHFTQLVWKATKEIGCGYKLCPRQTLESTQTSEAIYIVCEYYPPGNYKGRFEENVGRKVE